MMALECVDTQFSVYRISGFPAFVEAVKLEEEILADAGLPDAPRFAHQRSSPTVMHVAVDDRGLPLGVASSTVGPLAELPLGMAMAAAGIGTETHLLVPDPCCELVSLAVDPEMAGEERVTGVTEALYRSFYRRAKQSQARSAVAGVDPWIFDLLTERYGVPFKVLGPPLELLGRQLLAVGGDLQDLEVGVRAAAPEFAAYLDLPYRTSVEDLEPSVPTGV
jgi:hypothetical protein